MFGFLRRDRSKREIIINCENLEIRAAVMENGRLEELMIEHPTSERIVGSIFKGRIQNLEHDLQAAFVDIGWKKNAFLHYWDMVPEDAKRDSDDEADEGPRERRRSYEGREIERRFPIGSEIMVQVTKGPIGTKGPRVTAAISLPGRYIVMMPGSRLKGVSRKITDESERNRLKKILARLPVPDGMGVIIRTAGAGASKGSFVEDLERLLGIWAGIQKTAAEKPAPCCLYQEPDLVDRVVRDWMSDDIDRIVIDSKDKYEKIREVAGQISRRARSKIVLYDGEAPIFDHFGVERQVEETFQKRVNLKSGGYIVFDETEAMIAIDVNTGRHKGRGAQEEAILEVNTEAVEEIARQLRLRNIGGIIVIDLIDMKSRKHQSAVYKAMKAALKRDKARTNVLPISELGLMEMTRQRVEESLFASTYSPCPYCRGHGVVKSALGVSVELQRQLLAVLRKRDRTKPASGLNIVVHPTVLERLRREDEHFLIDLQSRFEGSLTFKSDPAKHVEFFAISDAATGEILYSSM